MPLHILKLCVGIDNFDQLIDAHRRRLAQRAKAGEAAELYHYTRMVPRRIDELEDGGSLYWVIRGQVQVRQPLLRIDVLERPVNTKRCRFVLAPEWIRTIWQKRRPHQGWRYLAPADAPADLDLAAIGAEEDEQPPPEMAAELRSLGLL